MHSEMNSKGYLTDVGGLSVGHATDAVGLTGCTVILCESGAIAGVDVRGSAPGTRETDLLRPTNLVEKVQAVLLSGGSAFGLDAAGGVMRYLEERGFGYAEITVDVRGVARADLQRAVNIEHAVRIAVHKSVNRQL